MMGAIELLLTFSGGAALVWAWQRRSDRKTTSRSTAAAGSQPVLMQTKRPASQIPIRTFVEIIEATSTSVLLDSIEQRSRLSKSAYLKDVQPVLEALADFVQMLPASESHHHAQPGGLWIHMLESADAALAIRSGMELPKGVGTEDRKRLEHRYTYAVLLAALMHDLGKPIADVRVSLYGDDPRLGRPWQALTGPMTNATHYRVEFPQEGERSYQLHQRLPAILLQRVVPQSTLNWLGEEAAILPELIEYLGGNDEASPTLSAIVKQADSESVRRNLRSGPRTRFATARVVPLIERLMEAIRRMLQEGGHLPLNKAGAVGWVSDGSVWFVCARLVEEVRNYLGSNESAQGIPGPTKNDRIFDEFEDYGVALPNPDANGVIWRVSVALESGWVSPPLTVLRIPLDKLYRSPELYPEPIVGEVRVLGSASKHETAAVAAPVVVGSGASRPAPASSDLPPMAARPALSIVPLQQASGQPSQLDVPQSPTAKETSAQALASSPATRDHAQPTSAPQPEKAIDRAGQSRLALVQPDGAVQPSSTTAAAHHTASTAVPDNDPGSDTGAVSQPQMVDQSHVQDRVLEQSQPDVLEQLPDAGREGRSEQGSFHSDTSSNDDGVLPPSDRALSQMFEQTPQVASGPLVIHEAVIEAPQQPFNGKKGAGGTSGAHGKPKKDATPLASLFLRWVQAGVASGHLKYNEQAALVHFAQEGMLLMSPEIFRRFLREHAEVAEGPVFDLRNTHGDKALQRLQNEVAKSPYTQRNGDENMHYYVFSKHDGTTSAVSSYFLLPQPGLLFNPVPPINSRIMKSGRPVKKLRPVGATQAPGSKQG